MRVPSLPVLLPIFYRSVQLGTVYEASACDCASFSVWSWMRKTHRVCECVSHSQFDILVWLSIVDCARQGVENSCVYVSGWYKFLILNFLAFSFWFFSVTGRCVLDKVQRARVCLCEWMMYVSHSQYSSVLNSVHLCKTECDSVCENSCMCVSECRFSFLVGISILNSIS